MIEEDHGVWGEEEKIARVEGGVRMRWRNGYGEKEKEEEEEAEVVHLGPGDVGGAVVVGREGLDEVYGSLEESVLELVSGRVLGATVQEHVVVRPAHSAVYTQR